MRTILTVVLALTLTYSFSQSSLNGKWYTFSFDPVQVVEYDFNDGIFSSNKFNWELKALPGTEKAKILKVIRRDSTLYYIMQDESVAPKVMINIFYIIRGDTCLSQPSLSEENTYQNDINSAISFIKSDSIRRPGMIFYSHQVFQRLKSLRNSNTISKPDYKKYLLGIIEKRNEFEKYAKKHKDDFGFMFFFTYFNNQTRVILAELGYNPLIPDRELEELNDKFKGEIELKELMDKALKFD